MRTNKIWKWLTPEQKKEVFKETLGKNKEKHIYCPNCSFRITYTGSKIIKK